MGQSIILKRSALAGKVPTTASLSLGELAINTYDGKIFLNRSGSTQSIQEVITTNVTNTGSITLTQTGSFGELVVTQDANLRRDLYVVRDIITNGNLDISGSITGSSLLVENNGLVNGNLTVLGAINARQFNIGVISSSIMYTSGSNKFGDTTDDTHQFTGSVTITGSIYLNGASLGGSTSVSGTFVFPENFDYAVYDTGSFLDFNTQSLAYNLNFNTATVVGSPIHYIGALSHIDDKTRIYPTATSIDSIVNDVYVGSVTSQSFYTNLPITSSGLNVSGVTKISGSTTITGSITISSGSITMPDRPAFRIIGTGGAVSATTIISGSKVTVDFNQGNCYNSTTGLFTAPIAGLYQVNAVVRTNSNSAGTITQAIVWKQSGGNDTAQIMIEFAANTTMNHAGGSTISKLAVGDTLRLAVTVGTISFDSNDNFSVAYIG